MFTAEYDADNRMTSVEYTDSSGVLHRQEFRYSGDGLLAEQKFYENGVLVDALRIIRDGMLAIQDRDSNNAVLREYTWGLNLGGGIGGLLNLNTSGQNYAYLYDGKGNVEAVLDASQNVAAAYRYDPFGVLLAKTGSFEQPFGFSTKRYNAPVSMVQYEARNYFPDIARWDRRDPLGEAGGINLYAFVGNNPVNWVDPWGLAVGHHYFPKAIFTKAGLPENVYHYFNKQVTGKLVGGHGWSTAHKAYSAAVEQLWQDYIRTNGIDPSKMTMKQAQNFINMIKTSKVPAIHNFLSGLKPLIGPTLFIIPHPCLFLPELGPEVCPGIYPSVSPDC